MASRLFACALGGAAGLGLATGCSTPFELPPVNTNVLKRVTPEGVDRVPPSAFRETAAEAEVAPALPANASPDEFVRYALYNNPRVEAALLRWRAAVERLPQVSAPPDPRLTFGYFLEEVQTRTGPQEARFGVAQTLPWFGKLQDREDAASKAAIAAWRQFEAARLDVVERVVGTLHDLAYLDAATRITEENLRLLGSLEEVVRARYRVGSGTHSELIRVQVELGQLEDRLAQLRAMRPSFVAELNAALNRETTAPVATMRELPGRVATVEGAALSEIARRSNPTLLALDEMADEQRYMTEVARKDGLPELTVGLEYIVTGQAINPATPGSGDDPVLLSFGVNLPLWRDKYDAGVRETMARRLAITHERGGEANRVAAGVQRAWFEHTDADRRVRLYEQTLIPKAEESLRASLAGFRSGDASFLELLDTERTLLEFAVAAERAKADRGKALARLSTLVGEDIPTRPAAAAPETEATK